MVDKVLCSVRLTSANCLESDSQALLDEKKREACLQGKYVVKIYWLKEQDFHDCRAFVVSANAVWQQRWGWLAVALKQNLKRKNNSLFSTWSHIEFFIQNLH